MDVHEPIREDARRLDDAHAESRPSRRARGRAYLDCKGGPGMTPSLSTVGWQGRKASQ